MDGTQWQLIGTPSSPSSMRRAVVYCRVSKESEASLETQQSACQDYIEKMGYKLSETFVETFSGAVLWARPVFSDVRTRIVSRQLDVLVVYSLDRVSRDQDHLGLILSELKYHGARLETVLEQFDDSPNGRLMVGIRGWQAETERLATLERTNRGKLARFLGISRSAPRPAMPRYIPYGYKRSGTGRESSYIVDDTTAPNVIRIFTERAAGASFREIAEGLTRDGIVAPGGEYWWGPTIQGITKNTDYIGYHTARRIQTITVGERKRKVVSPDDRHIHIPTERIISDDLWLQVRALDEKPKTKRKAKSDPQVLCAGKVFCYCGYRMRVEPRRGILYYRCTARSDRPRTLENHRGWSHRAAKLDPVLWNEVAEWIRDYPKYKDRYDSRTPVTPEKADELRALERRQDRLEHLTRIVDDPAKEVAELNQVKAKIREIMQAPKPKAKLLIDVAELSEHLDEFTPDERRRSSLAVVDRITAYPDRVEIVFEDGEVKHAKVPA